MRQVLLFARGEPSAPSVVPERPLWARAIVRCQRLPGRRRVRVLIDPPQPGAGCRVSFPRAARIDGAYFCVETLRECRRGADAPYYRASGRIARLVEAP